MSDGVLLTLVLAELAFVGAGALALVGHGLWSVAERRIGFRWRRGAELTVRATLLDALPAGDASPPANRTRPRLLLPIMLDLAGVVTGAAAERLGHLARTQGVVDEARQWAHSRRWSRRLRAARLLATFAVEDGLLLRLARDRHPAVRAAAADGCSRRTDEEAIDLLLGMLDDPEPMCRFAARAALLDARHIVQGPLVRYLSRGSAAHPEVALEVAAERGGPAMLPLALRYAIHPRAACRSASAAVLGRVGGRQASVTLGRLLTDPEPEVRRAAARWLGELRQVRSAGNVALLLTDPDWDVRRAAALALRGLGAPGRLHLRRAMTGPDPFAADIARQVLELPEGTMEAATG